jgi:hypothetical protein
MTANEKLTARLARLTTEQLVEISVRLTLTPTNEAIIVCNRAERELAKRMTKTEFAAHMDAVEALLDAAA